jgi:hypothetical protein
MHMVRFQKTCKKINQYSRGGWFPKLYPAFLFSWAPPLLLDRFIINCRVIIIPLEPCALNAEIQHFVLSFSISYWDLMKFPYFTDTTKKGLKGWKEAQRQGEDRVILRISLIQLIISCLMMQIECTLIFRKSPPPKWHQEPQMAFIAGCCLVPRNGSFHR